MHVCKGASCAMNSPTGSKPVQWSWSPRWLAGQGDYQQDRYTVIITIPKPCVCVVFISLSTFFKYATHIRNPATSLRMCYNIQCMYSICVWLILSVTECRAASAASCVPHRLGSGDPRYRLCGLGSGISISAAA